MLRSPPWEGLLCACGFFHFSVPACALFCFPEGSAALATLEQASFSLEREHSGPPAASNRLSLENSDGGRETNRGGGEDEVVTDTAKL